MSHPRQQFLINQLKRHLFRRLNTHIKVAVCAKLRTPDVGCHRVTRVSAAPDPGVVELLRMLGTGRAALEHQAISEEAAQAETSAPGPGKPNS